MPALLAKDDREQWLTGSAAEAKAVLQLYPQDCVVAYQVGTRVNSPQNNDAALIDPIDTSSAADPQQTSLIQEGRIQYPG